MNARVAAKLFAVFALFAGFGWGSTAAQAPPSGQAAIYEAALAPKAALAQHRALSEALAALAPGRPGVRDVYVLAAGLWGDPVFQNEAREGGKILTKRFGDPTRSLLLLNGPEPGRGGAPSATPANLNSALAAIGEAMNGPEDVLILFLTSHGTQQGASFQDGERLRGALPPAALGAALKDAGVETRIVIVSACYSGVYVPAVSSPRTAVFTAAASDRTSFGCEPENSWTWFGDAFLNTALRNGAEFTKGFELAKATIQGWEVRQGERPSRPQSAIGAEIAPILPSLGK